MAANIYASGVGGSSGDELATVSPLYVSGAIWYVNSSTGSDAVSPRGKERIRPLATLAQAVTNAAAGDIIVLMTGHAETLTSGQTINKSLTIIGEGVGGSMPTFTRNADIILLDLAASPVTLGNIKFAATTYTSSTTKAMVRMTTSSARLRLRGCAFYPGQYDTGPQVEFAVSGAIVSLENTSFISTATTPATAPESAIKVTTAVTAMYANGLTFDGGVSGWSNPYAFNGAAAVSSFEARNVYLYGDSDITFASSTVGQLHIAGKSGSARVVWA